MYGPFVHRIDPVFGEIAGFYLWFYGLSYSLGFLSIFLWFKRVRRRFGIITSAVKGQQLDRKGGLTSTGRMRGRYRARATLGLRPRLRRLNSFHLRFIQALRLFAPTPQA